MRGSPGKNRHMPGLVQRIPRADLHRVIKPDLEIPRIAASHPRVKKLLDLFHLPAGTVGCTGSLLCGLENGSSDIDMVVYGKHWFTAQALVRQGIADGRIEGMSPEMWRKVYEKRKPDIPYEVFVLHEQRKWNRGQIEGTYFDILYTRSYDNLAGAPAGKGEVLGKQTIVATVTDASLAFDNPGSLRGRARIGEQGALVHPHLQRAGAHRRDHRGLRGRGAARYGTLAYCRDDPRGKRGIYRVKNPAS